MILNTEIQGIPCQVRVLRCFQQPPMGPSADSDMDCYGYTEIDFEVLDRRGHLAPWLERKLMSEDRNAIEQEIIEAKRQEQEAREADRLDYENAFNEYGAYA